MKQLLWFLFLLWSGSLAAAGLAGLTPEQLAAMQADGALVVDVRTPEEWTKTGMIPGSQGLTYFDAKGAFDKAGWLKQLQPLRGAADRPIILVCRSGHRSATVGKMLLDEAGYSRVYHLENGIKGWDSAGKPLASQPPCRGC